MQQIRYKIICVSIRYFFRKRGVKRIILFEGFLRLLLHWITWLFFNVYTYTITNTFWKVLKCMPILASKRFLFKLKLLQGCGENNSLGHFFAKCVQFVKEVLLHMSLLLHTPYNARMQWTYCGSIYISKICKRKMKYNYWTYKCDITTRAVIDILFCNLQCTSSIPDSVAIYRALGVIF